MTKKKSKKLQEQFDKDLEIMENKARQRFGHRKYSEI